MIDLKSGQSITVSVGRRQQTFMVHEEGEQFKLERVPSRKEVVEKLGYDPARLAEVMRCYWRCE